MAAHVGPGSAKVSGIWFSRVWDTCHGQREPLVVEAKPPLSLREWLRLDSLPSLCVALALPWDRDVRWQRHLECFGEGATVSLVKLASKDYVDPAP